MKRDTVTLYNESDKSDGFRKSWNSTYGYSIADSFANNVFKMLKLNYV